MKIIYLHGFGSVGLSDKSRALINRYGAEHVVCPDLPMDPSKVIALVDSIVHANKDFPLIFVGTSLGGLYANYFGQRYDTNCILINPSTQPSVSFANRLGEHTNYATGVTFAIVQDMLDQFAGMEEYLDENQNGDLISMFLASDDDVLDPTIALNKIPFTKHKVVTTDGGHRYDKNWDLVIKHIDTML